MSTHNIAYTKGILLFEPHMKMAMAGASMLGECTVAMKNAETML